MRAAALLPAVTGNIGKPGAGFYYLNGKAATRGVDMAGLQGGKLRRKPVRADQPYGSGGPSRGSAQEQRAVHLEQQHRRVGPEPDAPAQRSRARTC